MITSAQKMMLAEAAKIELDCLLPVVMLHQVITTLPEYDFPAAGEADKARSLALQFISAYHLAAIFGCRSTLRNYFRYKSQFQLPGLLCILDPLHPQQPRCIANQVPKTKGLLCRLLDGELLDGEFPAQTILLYEKLPQHQNSPSAVTERGSQLHRIAYAQILLAQTIDLEGTY